jgi:hypothetical protein
MKLLGLNFFSEEIVITTITNISYYKSDFYNKKPEKSGSGGG